MAKALTFEGWFRLIAHVAGWLTSTIAAESEAIAVYGAGIRITIRGLPVEADVIADRVLWRQPMERGYAAAFVHLAQFASVKAAQARE